MTTYTISISQQQQELITAALAAHAAATPNNNELGELLFMFEELPLAEGMLQSLGNAPGATVHGFAL